MSGAAKNEKSCISLRMKANGERRNVEKKVEMSRKKSKCREKSQNLEKKVEMSRLMLKYNFEKKVELLRKKSKFHE